MSKLSNAAEDVAIDWVNWSGGECPVADGVPVDVRYRDGEVRLCLPANLSAPGRDASFAFWRHDGMANDIVAYRLSGPPAVLSDVGTKLEAIVRKFMADHDITFDEMIFDTDSIAVEATTLIADLCAVVGYPVEEAA